MHVPRVLVFRGSARWCGYIRGSNSSLSALQGNSTHSFETHLPRQHQQTCDVCKDADLRGRGEMYAERAIGSRSLPLRLREASLHTSELMHTPQHLTRSSSALSLLMNPRWNESKDARGLGKNCNPRRTAIIARGALQSFHSKQCNHVISMNTHSPCRSACWA